MIRATIIDALLVLSMDYHGMTCLSTTARLNTDQYVRDAMTAME